MATDREWRKYWDDKYQQILSICIVPYFTQAAIWRSSDDYLERIESIFRHHLETCGCNEIKFRGKRREICINLLTHIIWFEGSLRADPSSWPFLFPRKIGEGKSLSPEIGICRSCDPGKFGPPNHTGGLQFADLTDRFQRPINHTEIIFRHSRKEKHRTYLLHKFRDIERWKLFLFA